jgi:hypothetical protein
VVAAEGLWTGSSTLPHLHHDLVRDEVDNDDDAMRSTEPVLP